MSHIPVARIYHRLRSTNCIYELKDEVINRLEQSCIDCGLIIGGVYFDTFKGAFSARTELRRLVRESEEGDVLVVATLEYFSRMSRSDLDYLENKLNHLRIYVPGIMDFSPTCDIDNSEQRLLRNIIISTAYYLYNQKHTIHWKGVEGRSKAGRPAKSDKNNKLLDMYREALVAEPYPSISLLAEKVGMSTGHAYYLVKKNLMGTNSDRLSSGGVNE